MSLAFAAASVRRLAAAPQASAVAVTVGSGTVGVDAVVVVPVTITRTNYSGTITLAASNLPANTTGVFSPATLVPGAITSSLTITTTPSTVQGVTSVLVTATCERLANVTGTCGLTVTNATGIFSSVIGKRYDGLSTDVLVSGAIPLAPTQLLRSNLANVGLFVGETQRAVYVEALGKDYAGGYVRSLLVQRHETLPTADTITATLRVMGTAPLTRLTKETCPAQPAAMWSGGTAAQLCNAKGVFHVVRPFTTWDRTHIPTSQHIDSYVNDESFFSMAAAPRGHATYEPVLHALQFYAATADTYYLRRGLLHADAHAQYALPLLAQLTADWHYQCEGAAAAYLLTGSETLLQYIRHHAKQAAYHFGSPSNGGLGTNPASKTQSERTRYRYLRMLMAADRCGLTSLGLSTTSYMWNAQESLSQVALGSIAARWPSGWWAFTELNPVDIKWFQAGEYVSTLALYHDLHDNTQGLVAMIGTMLDLSWPYYRTAFADKGFPYTTPQIAVNPPGTVFPNQWWGDGDTNPNSVATWATQFWVFVASWYSAKVGGATGALWKTRAQTMIEDSHAGYVKYYYRAGEGTTFDQNFWNFPSSVAALSGDLY